MGSSIKTNVRVCRGMIFWLDSTKAYGMRSTYHDRNGATASTHIQLGSRPHLVVSSNQNNWHAPTCNVVPLTTQSKPDLGNVHVCFEIGGKRQTALVEQIKTVDMDALGEYMCTVSDKIMSEVEAAIAIQVGLRPAIRYVDMKLSNIVENLERVVTEIIQEKAGLLRDCEQTATVAQVEDAALRLGVTIESLFPSEHAAATAASDSENYDVTTNKDTDTAPLAEKPQNITAKPPEKVALPSSKEQKRGAQNMLDNGRKYDGLTPIEKFNAKYGKIPSNTNISEQAALEPVRKRGSFWTDESRRAFLLDCKSLTVEQIMQKWQLGSKRSVNQTRYACEKYFKSQK